MSEQSQYQELALDEPVWERFFSVYPLVLVGTCESDGGYDLAPKHLAMPMSWDNHFGFVCTPRHGTYRNLQHHPEFTVSYPRPDQLLEVSLAASPRCTDGHKMALEALELVPARVVNGVLVAGAYVHLECRLEQRLDNLGENSLLIGKVVSAQVDIRALREFDRDDNEVIAQAPLLGYLHPFRFSIIDSSQGFPLPEGFKR